MSELRREPSPNELLDRILELEARLSRIETGLGAVAKDLDRLARSCNESEKLDAQLREIFQRDINWLGECLMQVTLKVLPNLAKDMCRFYDLAGPGDQRAYNELDHGKKKR
jgi:hypothetical protein